MIRTNLKKQLLGRLLLPFGLFMTILFVGTIGYHFIEGYNFLESVYITVITISTVGYGEVRPFSDAGRIFTILLILVNIGLFSYVLALVTRYFFEGDFLRNYKILKMKNRIEKLENHVIICGFGRNGHETAQVLYDNGQQFVVIEKNTANFENLKLDYYLTEDATQDEVLIEAGIKRARAIVSTLPQDTDNLFVVLTARQLNPDIQIISRASKDSSVEKLKVAGAKNVIMPDKIGGAHMATLVLNPDVVEVLSLMSTRNNSDFKIVEIAVSNDFILEETDFWKSCGCTVLSIKNHDGKYILNPPHTFRVTRGEKVILMGSNHQIEAAKEMLSAGR